MKVHFMRLLRICRKITFTDCWINQKSTIRKVCHFAQEIVSILTRGKICQSDKAYFTAHQGILAKFSACEYKCLRWIEERWNFMERFRIWIILISLAIGISGCAFTGQETSKIKNISEETGEGSAEKRDVFGETRDNPIKKENSETERNPEKGYNLPLEPAAREEAEEDCMQAMEKIGSIYIEAEKGEMFNPVLKKETILQMYETLQETGCPVTAVSFHYSMGNYEKMEAFLSDCLNGRESDITLYKICIDGGINRSKFIFDGSDMYVVDTVSMWNEENKPHIANHSYTRIKAWDYTEKGWFSYEYCVPEYPEVTEMVNGYNLLRVSPMKEEYIRMAETYLLPIGYQGNNLMRSDWDADHMEELDYNGLYEYLYSMKYQNTFESKKYSDGIPKEEFENLITEFLPVTAEALEQYAVFDAEKQTYIWKPLGPVTYMANSFSCSIPEVTDITEQPDGTIDVSIDAVCPTRGKDFFMSHVLTLRILEDGSVRYIKNQILGDELEKISDYQYRLPR